MKPQDMSASSQGTSSQGTSPQRAAPWQGVLYSALPALLVCGGLGTLLWQGLPPAPELQPAATPGGCAAGKPVAFTVGYPDDGGTATLREDGFHLLGSSWLRAQVCGPGTLTIEGDGDQAGDEPPRLEISLNGTKLASEAFAQTRTVQVTVPAAGELTLAYLNDYYLSEYRIVVLEQLELESQSCAAPLTVEPGSQNIWDAELATASLVYDTPLVFNVCGDGNLDMKVWGKEAGGEWPTVRFEQGSQLLRELQPSTERQTLSLPVRAGPLTVRLVNPYVVQKEDRNLYLRRVEFAPEGP
ncbi:hypothetical protein Deipr_2065 (plasmid) [Deinococcus proteolyticus MRP]|uniref:Uncharacterized protein n=2 Tax=Deinococcus proteolyticus TaxID=55148 RepID=F0RPZ4_DEIPM|nr:hypothetical protein Deipr_2065 [Deinococcus proteolyticus MRP]